MKVCTLPVSLQSPELPVGHPLDLAVVFQFQRWGRTVRCGVELEDLCHIGIHPSGRFSVCGGRGRRGADPSACS